MFEVTTTGLNKNYGKKGQKRLMGDYFTLVALKHGWITNKFKYVGNTKNSKIPKVPTQEKLMPIKRIDVLKTLEDQNRAIQRMEEKLWKIKIVNEDLAHLVKTHEVK